MTNATTAQTYTSTCVFVLLCNNICYILTHVAAAGKHNKLATIETKGDKSNHNKSNYNNNAKPSCGRNGIGKLFF